MITVVLEALTIPFSPNKRSNIADVVVLSTALKGSSRTSSGAREYTARARACTRTSQHNRHFTKHKIIRTSRCFCPPLIFVALDPTAVRSPSGRLATS